MEFHEYHRNLPHWRQDGAVYFVTWRLSIKQRVMSPDERTAVMNALRHFHEQRYFLVACVVMDDHVHVLVHFRDGFALSGILQSWKSYTSKLILKAREARPPFWQDESFDRIVRDEKELDEKLTYIRNNPFKRWPELTKYEWTWWPEKGLPP